MTSNSWRASLSTVERYDNIENLTKSIEAKGLSPEGAAYQKAFAAEDDAYNTSESKEQYNASIHTLIPPPATSLYQRPASPISPGVPIGPHPSCHHLADGLTSTVYRTTTLALKVITSTRPMPPHDPHREIAILKRLTHPNIIPLLSTFRDHEGRLVLEFPLQPLTLSSLLTTAPPPLETTRSIFRGVFAGLEYLHNQGIIHRDIKPSNILLSPSPSPSSPSSSTSSSSNPPLYTPLLADLGTAWHPLLSPPTEPPASKALEVGTSAYRAPETLFGHAAYGPPLDIWAAGCVLAECLSPSCPPTPLFESRGGEEDGNQLSLILSIFKTLGTPTVETWPEARGWRTEPWGWYREFAGRGWEEILPGGDGDGGGSGRDLVAALVVYESSLRLTAAQALGHPFLALESQE